MTETEKGVGFIADMHTHTLASTHAYSTITENARWAAEHGIKYLGMTDHSVKMEDSPHRWHFENLGIIPDHLEGVRVFKGVEADIIDTDGNLDVPDEYFYDILEWVNVSMHQQVIRPMSRAEHTKAYLNVLKNPYVDVICHSEDPKYDYDFDEVCRACADSGRLIEVNNCRILRRPAFAERYIKLLEACEKHGTGVIVGSDAHFYTQIGEFAASLEVIEKAGFPLEKIVNSSEERFTEYLSLRGKS